MSAGNKGAPRTLHIRSQELQSLNLAGRGATSGFSAFSIDSLALHEDAPRRHRLWREIDLRRAIVAARRAKLRDYRVEVATDGTISIVVGTAAMTGANRTARR